MARGLSLLLLIGFGSATLTHGWAENAAVLAVDVQEAAPAEIKAEEATASGSSLASASPSPVPVASATATAGAPRRAPDLRPPR